MERVPSPARPDGPLRLLWVIDSLAAGGAEALTVSFARAVDPDAVDLRVVCLKEIAGNPFEESLRAEGVSVENLGSRNLRDVEALRRLIGRIRAIRPDVVHAHLTYASIWAPLAARLAGRPAVATLHLPPSTDPAWSRAGARERLRSRVVSRWCERVVAVSRFVADAHRATGRLSSDRLVVVHNGIDTSAFRPADPGESRRARARTALGVPMDVPLVAAVSVLRPGKGVGTLLETVAGLPDVRLAVAGDGPLAGEIATRARALGVAPRVELLGFRRDVPEVLAAADLLALPSETDDALPTVLMEAAAAGLPVVATRVGGVPEIVVHGETGLLVNPGNARDLRDAIATLLADPSRRKAMGRRARERAQCHFSLDAWRERLGGVYAVALGGQA
ncbi:MAG: glycosyltransferase [Gemmatimonadota bacterium]|nr:glycosyltransferase [Gemmatimonadota bacterium]